MGNRIKAWNLLSRLLFIIVFAASVGVFWLTRTGEGFTDFIINMVFALLAAVFLISYFAGCARPAASAAAALARVTDNIRRSDEDARTIWTRYAQNQSLFDNRRLDERWNAYLRQLRRLQKQNALTADVRIDDYIDEELIYSAINKPFCDQLGGVMSGLGILFTFIGLVYGLRNFDATTVDVMQTSTQALMAGIKIAFLTSIFGLIYSLIFGIVYKKLLRDCLRALYDFQDAFEDGVRPVNEHAAENAMLRLASEQNTAIRDLGDNIGTQVSDAIIRLMQPAVDDLRSTITQYVTVAIEDQRAGMEKVVRYFLESMNTSLGGVFAQLKARTEELARFEKQMIDSISAMTTGMGQLARDLADAQSRSQEITHNMASYTSAIEQLTAAQQRVTENMRVLMEDYHRLHEEEEEYIRSIAAAADSAAAGAQESRRAVEKAAAIAANLESAGTASAREISASGQSIARSADAVRSMSDRVTTDIGAAAERIEKAAGELEGGLSRALRDSLDLMDDSIARLTNTLAGVNAAAGNVTQAMKTLPKTVSNADSDVRATAKAIDGELKTLLKAVTDVQKSLTRFSADLDRRMGG